MQVEPTAAIKWHASIVSDTEFEIIEVDGKDFVDLDEARAWVRFTLADQPSDDARYYAEITEGAMRDYGDDDWPDWVFESDATGYTERIDL